MASKSLIQILAASLAPKMRTLNSVGGTGGWNSIIRESFGGAWQAGITVDQPRNLLAFSAVFACVTVIANDIAKLAINQVEINKDGIAKEIRNAPMLAVLRRPNKFQHRIKFIEQWIVSKLLYGNAYILKRRDANRAITSLNVLDPQRVQPLITEDGDVYYQVGVDHVAELQMPLTVPATEIMHDTMTCLWHPLIGVSPIFACGMSATMGNKIQANSTKFFTNMSRPSGLISAPGTIADETAKRLKEYWEDNFRGNELGRVAIMGDGLKYEPMTIPADDAQLIEQLKWTVEDVARCFHIPLYKIGGPIPSGSSIEHLSQTYYSDCLQSLIESLEITLDMGFELPPKRKTELDLDGLIRMDQGSLIKSEAEAVKGAIKTPNESRRRLNLGPLEGGDSAYLQQQNYSLEALARRDAQEDPFGTATPPPDDSEEEETEAVAEMFVTGLIAA